MSTDVTQAQKVWGQRISREEKAHKGYRKRAREVEDIFRSDIDGETLYVPLYWSVVGVEHCGVYSNQPVPEVMVRNEKSNAVYQSVATALKRGLDYCVDHPSFDQSMHRSIDDFLAMGLGTLRVKVDSVINRDTSRAPIFAMQQTPMGPQQVQVGEREVVDESIGDQTVRWEYVPYARFGWEPCNDWKHCGWIYFRHRMTPLQIKKRFGRMISASKDESDRGSHDSWKQRTYDIYEIWDKNKREVLFFAKSENDLIEVTPDPLKLIDFWPVPGPMMCNLPSEELIPQPDYDYIEHYDRELNRLQQRRMSVLEQIKAVGAFDQSLEELGDILEAEDGEMKPINGLMQRLQSAGGVENALWFLPIQEKLVALQTITEQIMTVKAQVDEILGIADIVRGVTAASETATAQEIKGRWVGVRLTRKRETVIYTVKQMMRIMAQLLASHITPENLMRMTQMQLTEEMLQIMQDDMMMDFTFDIETDSTIAKDEFREKEAFGDMLNGVAQFASTVLPMVQQNAMPAGVSSAILSAALRPYSRYDRNLETELGNLPQTMGQLQQLGQQAQQLTQQTQQQQAQIQGMQQYIQQIEQQAKEAKAAKEAADAALKQAQTEKVRGETRELYGETKPAKLDLVVEASKVDLNRAQAEDYREPNRGSQ
jgi:predicted  nucleic acid-binding Zn-ribbon protein